MSKEDICKVCNGERVLPGTDDTCHACLDGHDWSHVPEDQMPEYGQGDVIHGIPNSEDAKPEPRELSIVMGSISKPLSGQLEGFGVSERKTDHLQRVHDSITVLYLNGYIPQSQANKCRDRLMNKIREAVESA